MVEHRNMPASLPIVSMAAGRRIWRNDMYALGDWEPVANEVEHGPRTEFADGIYVVTVHEGTPVDWLKVALKATIASDGQHPGPDLMPGSNYDSFIAVMGGRIIGGALVALESGARYLWTVHLKPDGNAHNADELFGEESKKCGVTFDGNLGSPPAIYTIWVHPGHRRKGIGGQLVQAVATYLWPVSGEALLSTSFVERSCRNDQGFGFEGNSWMLLTCLWRIAISHS